MLIDCATCPVQGEGCPDCVVAFLLDRPAVRAPTGYARTGGGTPVDLDPAERRALDRLAVAGLVPPPHPGSHAARAFGVLDDAPDEPGDRNDPFVQAG